MCLVVLPIRKKFLYEIDFIHTLKHFYKCSMFDS